MQWPYRWPQPSRFELRRRWEQVTEMKSSNHALELVLKGRGFSRVVSATKSMTALAVGGRGAKTQAKKPARQALHALILTTTVFLFMGAGDDSARFKDLGHPMMGPSGCAQLLLASNHSD